MADCWLAVACHHRYLVGGFSMSQNLRNFLRATIIVLGFLLLQAEIESHDEQPYSQEQP